MKLQKRFVTLGLSVLIAATAMVGFIGENTSQVAAASPAKTFLYDITDLGVKFDLPFSLVDLGYIPVHLHGDQGVNSVEFTTKRLQDAGCTIDMAPMGILTYDSDKGGTKVGHARGSNLYYIKPDGRCHVNSRLQPWQKLRDVLHTLRSDGQQ